MTDADSARPDSAHPHGARDGARDGAEYAPRDDSPPAAAPASPPRQKIVFHALVTLLLLGGFLFTTATLLRYLPRRLAWDIDLGKYAGLVFWGLVVGYGILATALAQTTLDLFVGRNSDSDRSAAAARNRARGFARFRLALYIALTLSIVSWTALHPFERPVFGLAASFAFILFGLGVLVDRLVVRIVPRFAVRTIDIVLMNAVVILVGIELGLRGFANISPSPLLARADQTTLDWLERWRYEPGLVRYAFPCNSAGDYDEEIDATRSRPRVVSIGDSFSVGVVPHYFHFTTVAERELDDAVEIYNMGAPSIGVTQYLYLLETEALPMEPDVVVLNLFLGNDIPGSGQLVTTSKRLRAWFDRESMLLYVLPKRMAALAREAERAEEEGTSTLSGEGDIGRILTDPDDILEAFAWVADPRLESPPMSLDGLIEIEATSATIAFASGEAIYRRLFAGVLRARELCGSIPLLVHLIPMHSQVEDSLFERVVERVPAMRDRDFPQRVMRRWLEANDIPYVDPLARLLALPRFDDGMTHAYLRNNTHYNGIGNDVAGKMLAQGLAPLLAIDAE